MEQQQHCSPEDMVRFLLGLCCQDDSSTTPVSRDEALDRRFEECWRKVIPVANSDEMRQRLDRYKSLSPTYEPDMYRPFAEALNYAFKCVSNIQVDGLPEFKAHIVFVPCDNPIPSRRESLFKPGLVILSLQDARKFHQLEEVDAPDVSRFISEIEGRSLSGLTWEAVLSAVEVKWNGISMWASLEVFGEQDGKFSATGGANLRLDEEPHDSQPATGVSSTTLVSFKRSASTAGMEIGAGISGGKRQRTKEGIISMNRQSLAERDGIYSAEKFSDSFSISHVLNLLVKNDRLWISWIDREGAIFSSGFSFFENLPLMLVLLLILQRFGRRQWGHISELSAQDHTVLLYPTKPDGTLDMKGGVGVKFFPDDEIHSSWTLLGRATTVVGANRKEDESVDAEGESGETQYEGEGNRSVGGASGEDLEDIQRARGEFGETTDSVMDDNGTGGIKTTERDPGGVIDDSAGAHGYEQARDAYRKASGDIIKSHNLVLKISWPEASRPEEWKIIDHVRALGESDKFIKGHIPIAHYARDFGRYSTRHIRDFLGIEPMKSGRSGTRILRLIVMDRLRPIYDLEGEQFWKAFWQCVACHHRLWVNGIHHGDISFNNLMYGTPTETGGPVGIVNDFDLATLVDYSTTNNDRTGTIPFMAIDLLEGGYDKGAPRLYRHDLESFVWVLTYITIANIQYKYHTITISPLPGGDTWFKDRDQSDRDHHIFSKRNFHSEYGHGQQISNGYYRYHYVIQRIIQYWGNFHHSLRDMKHPIQPRYGVSKPLRVVPIATKPEVDNPAKVLELFVSTVETSLRAGGGPVDEFAEVKDLLEVVENQIVAAKHMVSGPNL